MLSNISRFFENCLKAPETESTEQKEQRLQLACAALLLELCSADATIDPQELSSIKHILHECFGLRETALDELWQLAKAEARNATSLYQFTSLINEEYDYAAKTRLLENLWRVAYADGRLDRYEEHMIRKVSDLLYLSHKDFIQTKLAVRPA